MNTIKAGIKLEITSWENDMDNLNTISVNGLTEDEAKFYIEFASLFKSCDSRDDKKNFGNTSDLTEEQGKILLSLVDDIVKKYPGAKSVHDIYHYEESADEFVRNLSSDILGNCEWLTFRVFESYKAYIIPSDIAEIDLGFRD
jgi:hypothetical protein